MLNQLLTHFTDAFSAGRFGMTLHAKALFNSLVVLEVTLASLFMIAGAEVRVVPWLKKIITMGVIAFFIQNYDSLIDSSIDGFIYAGQVAANAEGSHTLATIKNPDQIVFRGFEAIKPGLEKLTSGKTGSGWLGLPSVDTMLTSVIIIMGLLCFFILAIQVFITYLEFLMVTSLGLILIPFGIFKPLAFTAEKIFGAVVSYGVKLMCLAFIVAVTDNILAHVILPETIKLRECLDFLLLAATLAFLAWHAPAVAASIVSGSPSMTAATVASAASSAAGAVKGAAGMAAGAAAAAASGVGSAARGASSVMGMAAAGAEMASSGGPSSSPSAASPISSGSSSGGSSSGSPSSSSSSSPSSSSPSSAGSKSGSSPTDLGSSQSPARSRLAGAAQGVGSGLLNAAKGSVAKGLKPYRDAFNDGKNKIPEYAQFKQQSQNNSSNKQQ